MWCYAGSCKYKDKQVMGIASVEIRPQLCTVKGGSVPLPPSPLSWVVCVFKAVISSRLLSAPSEVSTIRKLCFEGVCACVQVHIRE